MNFVKSKIIIIQTQRAVLGFQTSWAGSITNKKNLEIFLISQIFQKLSFKNSLVHGLDGVENDPHIYFGNNFEENVM